MGLSDLVHNLRSKTRSPRTSADSYSTSNSQQCVPGETAALQVDSANFLLAASTGKLAAASSPADKPPNSRFFTPDSHHGSRHLLRLRRSHERMSGPRTNPSQLFAPHKSGAQDTLPDRPPDEVPVSESRFSRRGVRSQRINSILEHSSRSLNFRFQSSQPVSDDTSNTTLSNSSSTQLQNQVQSFAKTLQDAADTAASSPSQSASAISFQALPTERSRANRTTKPLRRPRTSRVMSSVDHIFRRDHDSKRSASSSVPLIAKNVLASETQTRNAAPSSVQVRSADCFPAPRSPVQRITSALYPPGKHDALRKKRENNLKQSLSQRSSSAGQVHNSDTALFQQRTTANAACPVREREPALPLGRSQSTPGKRSGSLKHRMRLNLPLLKVPTSTNNNSTSVSFKTVRNSSGERRAIKDDSILYAGLVGQETPIRGGRSNRAVRSATNANQPLTSTARSKAPSYVVNKNNAEHSIPRVHSGVWNAVTPRIADGPGVKVINHLTEADRELLDPEHVEPLSSQTSFRRYASGSLSLPSTPNNGVAEDSFILQIEDAYVDGGFVISLNGLEGTPEKLVRKVSNGMDNDGVPTSSRNLIIVRSLDEFTRVRTIRGNGTLGRGITGSVYLAKHEPTRKYVAIKRINAFDEKKREELKKELTTLISHESRFLVRSHGAFYDGMSGIHIVLEYMDRGSLDDVVSQFGKIPEPVLRKITEHCLLGLRFLHENHVLHRDVKTANILMSSKVGRAKLGDFGLARDLKERKANCNSIGEGSTSETETFVGTFAYMSPERLRGNKYTYASDIWGLGMVVIECALGRPPFDSLHQFFEIVEAVEGTPPVSLIEGRVSSELADFIRLTTDHNPKRRPPASELLKHPWIKAGRGDRYALKRWLNELPAMHHDIMGDRSGGSVRAQARQLERMRETNQLR
ncbi:unnamed protein product [Agarophyton chilense]